MAIDMMKKIGETFSYTGVDELTKPGGPEYRYYRELSKVSK